MSRLIVLFATLLPVAAGFTAGGVYAHRPLSVGDACRPRKSQIRAMLPVEGTTSLLGALHVDPATSLMANSAGDKAIENAMVLLGGPAIWALSVAFVLKILFDKEGGLFSNQ